jgi:lipopolysaccharide biosynthesis glycosyltransferase
MFTRAFSKKKVVEPDGSREPVHIAVCFDENMDMPFLALAESLRYSIKNRYRTLIIHAIYSGQLSDTVLRLTSRNSNNFIVEFIRADIELQALPLRDVFTHATYTRLYLHIILSDIHSDIHKVIYLDPDTIVVNDISKLYDTELNGCCLAASQDRGTAMMHSEYGFKVDKKIGLNAKHGDDINTYLRNVIGLKNGNEHLYFNDGVLLIDLDLWRNMNILGLAIDFLRRNPDCLYLGQDALNAVLATRYIILDDRWNSLVVAFHDANLLCDGLQNIECFLQHQGIKFRSFFLPNVVYVIIAGDFADIVSQPLERVSIDRNNFIHHSRIALWKEIASNVGRIEGDAIGHRPPV